MLDASQSCAGEVPPRIPVLQLPAMAGEMCQRACLSCALCRQKPEVSRGSCPAWVSRRWALPTVWNSMRGSRRRLPRAPVDRACAGHPCNDPSGGRCQSCTVRRHWPYLSACPRTGWVTRVCDTFGPPSHMQTRAQRSLAARQSTWTGADRAIHCSETTAACAVLDEIDADAESPTAVRMLAVRDAAL